MTYEEAEDVGYERQQADGTPTLAQWARAQAVRATLSNPHRTNMNLPAIALQVNVLAELIVTGSLPDPPPGTYYG